MGPYLIHPDKLDAIHNIVIKQKIKRATKSKPEPATAAPSGNIVLKLMQQAYTQQRDKLGRSY